MEARALPVPGLAARQLRERAARLQLRGEFEQAEQLLLRARRILDRARVRDADYASVLNDLGVLWKARGWFEAARAAYRTALPIFLCARPADRDTIATLYHNLGGIEHASGRYATAERLARRGLSIRRRLPGSNILAIAADEAALAVILMDRRKLGASDRLSRHALAAFRRQLGPRHYEIGMLLASRAVLHQVRGHTGAASRCYVRSLEILEAAIGRSHPDVAVTIGHFAVLRAAQGRHVEADRLYRRALRILTRRLGSRNPRTLVVRRNLKRLRGAR